MSSEIEDLLATDNAGPSEDNMSSLSGLVTEMQKLEAEVAEASATLKSKTEQYRHYSENLVPSKMDELNMTRITLGDGSELTILDNIGASITVANREAAYEWLRNTGKGDIIKNEVVSRFGAGKDEESREAVKLLADAGFSVEQKESIHASTLKAFVKEELESGTQFPDTFTIFQGRKTKLKKA